MAPLKVVGIILVVLGLLGLVYGGFSYTEDRKDVDLGPIEFSIEEKEQVNIPVWAGVASVVVGAGLLAVGGRRA